MSEYYGDISEDQTLYIPFNTFDSNDPSASVTITNLADADIKVHKDGSATQIVTDGATIAIDFDSITGNHLITIDTSAHADYATGSDYMVRIEGTTVDAATINAWVGSFSIENRHSAGALRPTTAGRTLDVTAGGTAGVDWGNVENKTTANDLSGTDIQLVDTATTVTGGATSAELAKVPKSDGTASWNATALAAINGECDTALTDYDGPTDTEMVAAFTEIKGATWATTDSLEAIRDRGDAAWTTGAGGSDRLLMVDTTIATLSSQTSFTLTAGSTDNDAYNNLSIVIEDVATSTQKAVGMVIDYVGSTKTVTLKEALAFTIAATDKVYILAENSLKSTVANRQLDVTATGAAGVDWANVENPTTALDLSGTDIQLVDTATALTNVINASSIVASVSGNVDGSVGSVTGGATSAAQTTAQNDLDIITGASGVNLLTATQASIDAIEVDTGTTIPATLGTPAGADMSADIAAVPTVAEILTTAMTEAYAADGVAPTLAQALFIIKQNLEEFAFAGTTKTVKKIDGSTTAATYTLDDGTNPTSSTRST